MKNTKLKKAGYWMSVITLGIVVGISLQFAAAWTEPTVAPPGGNLGGPINTGAANQSKTGGLAAGVMSTGAMSIYSPWYSPSSLTMTGRDIYTTSEETLFLNWPNTAGNVQIGGQGETKNLIVNGVTRLTGNQMYIGNSNNNYYGDGTNLAARMNGDFYVQNQDGTALKNVRANDFYIQAVDKWASELGGGAVASSTKVYSCVPATACSGSGASAGNCTGISLSSTCICTWAGNPHAGTCTYLGRLVQ